MGAFALRSWLLAAWLPLIVVAQQPLDRSEIDAVSVSPDKFTVLLENQHVRVVE